MHTTTEPSRIRRPRTEAAPRREMVARYQRSGLTQRVFCEQAGLPLSTLQWWLVKGRREAAAVAPVLFREVVGPEVVRPGRDRDVAWAVEMVLPTGVTVRLRDPLAPSALGLLLRRARC